MIWCEGEPVCERCGRRTFGKYRQVCAIDSGSPVVQQPAPMLLGDRIESALTSVGITKDRWAWFVGQFGTPPTPGCGGCDKRHEVLNDADLWMRHAASELGSAAANAISKVWAPISWLKKDQTQPRNTPEELPKI